MARIDPSVRLRLPQTLRDRLKVVAASNNRSMNAEIVARLDLSFDTTQSLDTAISRLIDQHIEDEVQRRLRKIAESIGNGDQ